MHAIMVSDSKRWLPAVILYRYVISLMKSNSYSCAQFACKFDFLMMQISKQLSF